MMQAPKDKHDIAAVEQLMQAAPEDVVPLLPELLTWVQDFNWPVAQPVAELLLQFPNELTVLIADVLDGDDYDWQYWLLLKIIPRMPFYSKMAFYEQVERIAALQDPQLKEYAEAAQQALHSFMP